MAAAPCSKPAGELAAGGDGGYRRLGCSADVEAVSALVASEFAAAGAEAGASSGAGPAVVGRAPAPVAAGPACVVEGDVATRRCLGAHLTFCRLNVLGRSGGGGGGSEGGLTLQVVHGNQHFGDSEGRFKAIADVLRWAAALPPTPHNRPVLSLQSRPPRSHKS